MPALRRAGRCGVVRELRRRGGFSSRVGVRRDNINPARRGDSPGDAPSAETFGKEHFVSRLAERLERRTLFATTVFTIDPALSAVTLEGEAAGFELQRQADGSLRARYDGAIVADYVAGTSIKFLGGSDVVAETRGRYDPGDAPGNYAAEFRRFGATVFEAAVRNLRLDVVSEVLPVSGGNFASAGEKVRVIDGRFSYDTAIGNDDSFDLADEEVANKTTATSSVVTGVDGVIRLTIPIDVTYEYDEASAELRLRGQIVAVAGPDGGLRPRVDANGAGLGTGYAGVFTTGGPAVAAVAAGDNGLRVSDFDSPALASATVTLLNRPDGAAEVLSVDVGGSGLASAYDAATGVLTVNGSANTAVYQQVLRTLTYNNTAGTPTLGERAVAIVVSDADGAGTAAESVISVEEPFDANVVRIGDGENRSATFVDGDGTVTTVALTGGGTATVRLEGATGQTVRRGGTVQVVGTNTRLLRVEATGTGPLSRLVFKTAGGNGAVDLPEARVDGALNTFGGRGVNASGAIDFNGRVNTASFGTLGGADVTATSIGKVNLAGSMADSTLTVEDPFAPALATLTALTVKGPITGSRVSSVGSIGSVRAGGLVNSEVYAGVFSTDRFPSAPANFINEASVGRLTLVAPRGASAFDNSVIAANNLGRLNLGVVDTDNGGTPFGVAADSIAGLVAAGPLGQRLRLANLDDPTAAAGALTGSGFTFGDLQIRVL